MTMSRHSPGHKRTVRQNSDALSFQHLRHLASPHDLQSVWCNGMVGRVAEEILWTSSEAATAVRYHIPRFSVADFIMADGLVVVDQYSCTFDLVIFKRGPEDVPTALVLSGVQGASRISLSVILYISCCSSSIRDVYVGARVSALMNLG